MSTAPRRILIAKPGLDGHDRGAKLIARILRDAGFEVIYTGIRTSPAAIASIAVQEDVDLVGLSILSGAHMGLTRKTLDALRDAGCGDVKVLVGGTVPDADIPALLEMGVAAVLATGTSTTEVVATVERLLAEG